MLKILRSCNGCLARSSLSYSIQNSSIKFRYISTFSVIKSFRSSKKYGIIIAGTGFILTKFFIKPHFAKCHFLKEIPSEKNSELVSPWLISSKTSLSTPASSSSRSFVPKFIISLWQSIIWVIKLSLRLCILSIRFGPLAVTYPIVFWSDRARSIWWKFAVWTIQTSGPTLIKLGQWASTRRDIFSKEFCDKMSVLHTKTIQRKFSLHCSSLDKLFGGPKWKSFLVSVESEPVGSGCIAQVYKGKLDINEFQASTGISIPNKEGQKFVDVAIKITRSGVRERIAIDLAILKVVTRILQTIVPNLLFVNPISCLDQFEIVLKRQVDLRNEAKALQRFSRNFDPNETGVRFPVVFCYSKDVIIETFEEGICVNRLVTGDDKSVLNQSASVKRRVALMGARALLKMIFVDNFVHGDLHPGNILIRFDDSSRGVHRVPPPVNVFEKAMDVIREKLNWSHEPRIRIIESSEYEDIPTLVILDTGIAIEETPQNLRNLHTLFRAVIETRGYDVGKLLLKHSPDPETEAKCSDPDKFCHEIEEVVRVARSSSSLRKLNISQLLSQLFSIVSRYQVPLETSFTTVVLAVMVLEGLGRSLDPDLDLFQCARPYLINIWY